jgi:EmrB/QacA subfamily drug resistance transporter
MKHRMTNGSSPLSAMPDGEPGQLKRPKSQNAAKTGHSRRWWIMATVAVSQLMVVLDTTIVNIALPSAQADLGFSDEYRQWIVTAYALALGSLLLLGGRISDIVGRRRTLLIGLIGFALASAVGGAASGFGVLVFARALQGVFAALLAPSTLSTLNMAFTDAKERNKAFAIYAAIGGGGAAVGLILGGALTEWVSWRWCLYVNLALAIPAAAGVLAFVAAKGDDDPRQRLDWAGALVASAGLFCLVFGLSNAEIHNWNAPLTVGMLTGAAVLLIGFVGLEARVHDPLLPLRIIANRIRAQCYLALAFGFCAMFAVFLFLTYFLQQNLGFSPIKAGLAYLPMLAGLAVTAGIANTRLIPRFGTAPVLPAGMLIAAAAMYWLTHLDVDSTYLDGVLGPLSIVGVGIGLIFAPAVAAANADIPPGDVGVASAMVTTSQQIGGAVGTAALSTMFASAVRDYAASHPPSPGIQTASAIHGYQTAFAVSCGLFLVGTLITAALGFTGRHRGRDLAVPEVSAPAEPRANGAEVAPSGAATKSLSSMGRNVSERAERSTEARRFEGGMRSATLLERGVPASTVAHILDLEYRNAQLEAENDYLAESLNLAELSGRMNRSNGGG